MITRAAIRTTLLELFEAETGDPIEELNDDQDLSEELGLDSVDMVSLIMQLERHFKIHLTHEELAAATTCAKLVDLVDAKVNRPATTGDAGKIAA